MHALSSFEELLNEWRPILTKLTVSLIAQKLQDFLDFIDIDNLFAWASDRPELQHSVYKWEAQASLLLNIDLAAALQLSVERREVLYFVQRHEYFLKEVDMLLLKGN